LVEEVELRLQVKMEASVATLGMGEEIRPYKIHVGFLCLCLSRDVDAPEVKDTTTGLTCTGTGVVKVFGSDEEEARVDEIAA
jgi:hypothetical protein